MNTSQTVFKLLAISLLIAAQAAISLDASAGPERSGATNLHIKREARLAGLCCRRSTKSPKATMPTAIMPAATVPTAPLTPSTVAPAVIQATATQTATIQHAIQTGAVLELIQTTMTTNATPEAMLEALKKAEAEIISLQQQLKTAQIIAIQPAPRSFFARHKYVTISVVSIAGIGLVLTYSFPEVIPAAVEMVKASPRYAQAAEFCTPYLEKASALCAPYVDKAVEFYTPYLDRATKFAQDALCSHGYECFCSDPTPNFSKLCAEQTSVLLDNAAATAALKTMIRTPEEASPGVLSWLFQVIRS